MRLRRFLSWSLCFVIAASALFQPPQVFAQQKRRTATPNQIKSRPKPRLVLGIVIDQFRYDYLTRFEDLFIDGGFKLLLNKGAVFANANYIHTPTYTACGHATFMSGSAPSLHGIIGNEWFDRDSGKNVTSVSDDSVKMLGGRANATGMSPKKLLGSTVGDEMKLASGGRAKVIGISFKDRSAILPVGKRPDAAYWYDATTGNLVSSEYYFKDLPDWVKAFNRNQRPDRFFGKRWEKLLPESAYERSTADDMPYEKGTNGNKFPYTLTGGEETAGPRFFTQFEYTPFANDYLVDFAKAAIENEKLGEDDVTDLLTISFSANDLVGHTFGPYSHEVEDITLRTDRTLANFFKYLDQKIGLNRIVIALTADHGVGPAPDQVSKLGYGGKLDARSIRGSVEDALNKQFGEEKWILSLVNGNIYLDESAIERRKLNIEEVERTSCQAILKNPNIADCLTKSQLTSGNYPNTMISRSVANGFYPRRNGNMVIVAQPYYIIGTEIVATHGTPYEYDTHVPVIFSGAGIIPGIYYNASSPADIAPTLSALLRIDAPSNNVGRVLIEAIKQRDR